MVADIRVAIGDLLQHRSPIHGSRFTHNRAGLGSSPQLQKDGHQELESSNYRLHLLPPMFYRAPATLLTLASFAFAIPTLYLVGDSTMADQGPSDIQGYVVPMWHCVTSIISHVLADGESSFHTIWTD